MSSYHVLDKRGIPLTRWLFRNCFHFFPLTMLTILKKTGSPRRDTLNYYLSLDLPDLYRCFFVYSPRLPVRCWTLKLTRLMPDVLRSISTSRLYVDANMSYVWIHLLLCSNICHRSVTLKLYALWNLSLGLEPAVAGPIQAIKLSGECKWPVAVDFPVFVRSKLHVLCENHPFGRANSITFFSFYLPQATKSNNKIHCC